MGAVWVVLGLVRESRPRISRGEADSQPRGLPRRFVLPLSAASTLRIWEALVLQSLGRVLQPEEELGSRGGERWGLAGRQAAVCSWAKAPFDSARGRGGACSARCVAPWPSDASALPDLLASPSPLTISPLISRLFSSTSLRPLFLLSMSLLGVLLLERWKPRFLFDFSGG